MKNRKIEFYPVVRGSVVFRLCYFQFGFQDRSLLWIVSGKLMDLFFFKIR